MRSIFDYVPHRDRVMWIAAHLVGGVSLVVGAGALGSWLLAALGCSAALLMAWPTHRSLLPVVYAVVVQGQWPKRNNDRNA